jgi:hypothetical protein
LPGLASNHDPPDLCLLSSQDYRREPLVPGHVLIFSYYIFTMDLVLYPLLVMFLLLSLSFCSWVWWLRPVVLAAHWGQKD